MEQKLKGSILKQGKRVIALLLSILMILTNGTNIFAESVKQDKSIANAEVETEAKRETLNFNQGWKFVRRNIQEATAVDYPLEQLERWENVDLPHTVRVEPYNTSGGINYQGPAMYRKHFMLPESYVGKKLYIEFEGVMGVTDVWVNGEHLQGQMAAKTGTNTQYGGYLPFMLDVTDVVKCDGTENVITVLTDNSDNTNVPPGKPQGGLDFTYMGGIYRNVWFKVCETVHITDSIYEDVVAGGGILVDYPEVTKESATVDVKTEVKNETQLSKNVVLDTKILDKDKNVVGEISTTQEIETNAKYTFQQSMDVKNPNLWDLDTPYMHTLVSTVQIDGVVQDVVETPIGIRKITMNANDGLMINGEPAGFLSGVNRHQEYAYIGFAASSSLQRRDAIMYKSAGFNIVRTAHHPQSVDFLNACDELGILVMESVPGWQHWSSDWEFEQRVKLDIRQMIRRDRNHPSILTFEISLNESPGVPASLTNDCEKIAKEEHPSVKTSAENPRNGAVADILYGTPSEVASWSPTALSLIREYGDYWDEQNGRFVDDCRVTRGSGGFYPGGEGSMVRQANNKLWNGFTFNGTGAVSLSEGIENYNTSNHRFAGVTMWIGIDHNRGYHTTMSPCGIWDLRRIPKYSYYAFESQRPIEQDSYLESKGVKTGPMLFVASSWGEEAPILDKKEGNPTLGTDEKRLIYVYSNAAKVKLSVVGEDGEVLWEKTNTPITTKTAGNLEHPPFEFSEVPYTKGSHLVAEGYNKDNVVIASQEVHTAGEPAKLKIEVDQSGANLVADGSDAVMAYAYVLDKDGNVCQEATNNLYFSVDGEASIIGDGDKRVGSNPVNAEAGVMGVYLRATKKAGDIKVKVASQGLESAELTFSSTELTQKQVEYVDIKQGASIEESSMYLTEKPEVVLGDNPRPIIKDNITVEDVSYQNSIETRNMQQVSYELNGGYNKLTAKVALKTPSSVVDGTIFKVYLDGVLRYQSEVVTTNIEEINLDISGAKTMVLCAEDKKGAKTSNALWLSPYIFEGRTAVDESELRNNLAKNKTASATSSDTDTQPSQGNDGSITSLWRSANDVTANNPQSWTVDLGELQDVRNANVAVEHDYLQCTYNIYTSADGQEWTKQASNSKTAHGNAIIDNFIAKQVRYVKVEFTEVKSTQGEGENRGTKASIKEFEVYEDKGASTVNDYNLKGLEIGGKDITFTPSVTDYTIELKGFENEFFVKALPVNEDATITINGKSVEHNVANDWSMEPYVTTNLDSNNQIVVKVTTPDGAGTKTYTIKATGESKNHKFDSLESFVPGVNGAYNWHYEKMDVATKTFTTLADTTYKLNAGEKCFDGLGEWVYSGWRYMHSSAAENAVRTFVAPKDGPIAFHLNAEKFVEQPGEVGFSLYKNGEKIWPEEQEHVVLGSTNVLNNNIFTEVEKDDRIQLVMDSNGSNGGDATCVFTDVTYMNEIEIESAVVVGKGKIMSGLDKTATEHYSIHATTADGLEINGLKCDWRLKNKVEGITISEQGELSFAESVTGEVVTIEALYNNQVIATKEVLFQRMSSVYASDIEWASASAGYGTVNKDKSSSGGKIQLTGESGAAVTYEKGIGTHATSKIVYNIKDQGYQAFHSKIGVDFAQNPVGTDANVVFKVFFNGDEENAIYESGEMVYDTPEKEINIPLDSAVETITLTVEEGINNWSDHADWADAQFLLETTLEKALLNEKIEQASEVIAQGNTQYTQESWTTFTEAYEHARTVYAEATSTEEDYIRAKSLLSYAQNGLVLDESEFKVNIKEDTKVKVTTDKQTAKVGEEVTFSIEVLDEKMELKEVKVIGASGEIEVTHLDKNNYKFQMPSENVEISVILVEVQAPDKTELNAEIEKAAAYEEELYTAETWSVFKEAYEAAVAISEKEEATADEIQRAIEELQAGIEQLEEKPEEPIATDKSDLEALLAYAQSQKEDAQYEHVVPVVKQAFEKAMTDAQVIVDTEDASQETIDQAYQELLKFVWMLGYTGDTSELSVVVDVARQYDLTLYTPETAQALSEALTAAEEVLANENALQEEITTAKDNLQSAIDGLKLKVDKSFLELKIKEADAIDLDKFLTVGKDNFIQALADAKVIYDKEDATEQEVTDAYKTLQNAIFLLREKPDKSKLEQLIKDSKAIPASKYTDETYAVLEKAIASAEKVYQNAESTKEEVAQEEQNLVKAINQLEEVQQPQKPGWKKQENGTWRYLNKDQNYATNCWQKIDQKWYRFDKAGYMMTGWTQDKAKTTWYYLKSNGVMATGWQIVDGKWYYFKSGDSGRMLTGWQMIDGKWYYLNAKGDMAVGWKLVDHTWYYLNTKGDMAVGWKLVDHKWYYLNANGKMAVGWKLVDHKWYYLNAKGDMAVGWKLVDHKWYYLNKKGEMKTGWVLTGGKWYYCNEKGIMLSSTSRKLKGKVYRFNKNGVCVNP